MVRNRHPSPQTQKLLAALLAQRVRWQHGYELCELTGLSSGTLYPILMRLSDRGMLESRWEPSEHEGRPLRKLYRLNAEGAAYAMEHTAHEGISPTLLSPGRT
jgi:DNA-binding PadR family transcriptional regulator